MNISRWSSRINQLRNGLPDNYRMEYSPQSSGFWNVKARDRNANFDIINVEVFLAWP